MKKLLQRLMLAVLLTSTFHIDIFAQNCNTNQCSTSQCNTPCPKRGRYTNKTFLMPRPHGVNLPMEMTTFHRFHHKNKHKALNNWGANLQVTGFYSDSQCADELGAYFGIQNKNTIKVDAKTGRTQIVSAKDLSGDIDYQYLTHVRGLITNEDDEVAFRGFNLSYCLKPEHSAYGLRFDLYHNLDRVTPGLFFKASLPLVHIANKTRLRLNTGTNVDPTIQELVVKPLGVILEGKTTQMTSSDLFGPTNPTQSLTSFQDQLKFAKHNCENINTGIADIDLALGYNFFYKDRYSAGLAWAITIPTGNEPKGEYVFEAIYGNGHHFAVGADLYEHYKLWGDHCHNLVINLMAKYRYLFESQQTRTLGLKRPAPNPNCTTNDKDNVIDWGHYYLLGEVGKQALVPAANILTQYVDVTPGSQFDGVLSLQYNFKGFTFDLGYNFFFKERETVRLRKKLEENKYAIAARSYIATAQDSFQINEASVDGNNIEAATISTNPLRTNQTQVVTCVAETPQQITHGIFGGLGYIFNEAKFPVMLGLGGQYDWKDNNAAIEKWSVWGKVGINF